MRVRRLYQVFDLEAEIVTGHPFIDIRDNGAVRTFHQVLGDQRTDMSRYPEHYELRLVALQDEESAIVTPVVPYKVIATGAGWKQSRREDDEKREIAQLTASRNSPDWHDTADETDRPVRNT